MPARREVCEEVVYAKLLLLLVVRRRGGKGKGGGVGKVLPRSAVKRQLNVVAILKRGNLGALGGRRGVGYECKGNIATVSTLRRIV